MLGHARIAIGLGLPLPGTPFPCAVPPLLPVGFVELRVLLQGVRVLAAGVLAALVARRLATLVATVALTAKVACADQEPPGTVLPSALDRDEIQDTRTAATREWMTMCAWSMSGERRRALHTRARSRNALAGPAALTHEPRRGVRRGRFSVRRPPGRVDLGSESGAGGTGSGWTPGQKAGQALVFRPRPRGEPPGTFCPGCPWHAAHPEVGRVQRRSLSWKGAAKRSSTVCGFNHGPAIVSTTNRMKPWTP